MAIMPQWFAYTEEMATAGVLVGGEPLQERDTATTVRVREGNTTTTDGPFAETKEVLGGYYLIDVENLDDALAWAAKCPLAPWGSVEVSENSIIYNGFILFKLINTTHSLTIH